MTASEVQIPRNSSCLVIEECSGRGIVRANEKASST